MLRCARSGTGPVAQPVFKTGEVWQPHAGSVRLRGRSVDDRIVSEDGRIDVVSCGSDVDTVIADSNDRITGRCEHVKLA